MNHQKAAETSYRPDIDGLRAIAVLSVIGFHAFPDVIKSGFIGVDIFFVISGFLISTIIFKALEYQNFSFIEFYSRRIRRIFPALITVLLACYVFGWFSLLVFQYAQLSKHVAAGAGFVSNFVLWNESGYFDSSADTKPLLHLWSLAVEEQFYLIWPLLLWLFHRMRFNLLLVSCAVGIVSFLCNILWAYSWDIFGITPDRVGAFYSPQTRFWELMIGSIWAYVLLYKYTPKTALSRFQNLQSIAGTILIIGSVFFIKSKSFPGLWALLPTIGALLIISAGTSAWVNRNILSNRLLVWIGLISYPLYLWHWPLLSFARLLVGEVPTVEIRVTAVIVAFPLAWMTYRFVEKPIRFGNHSGIKTIILIMLMIAVGYAGFYSYQRSGQSFGKEVDEITKMYQVAPGDLSREPHDGECDSRFPQFAEFHRCRLSQPSSSPDVVIIGDSHSGHYYNSLEKNLPDKVVMNIGQQACLPFSTNFSKECKKNIEITYSFIEKQKSIKTVYLAGFWYHLLVGGFAKELNGGGILGHVNDHAAVEFQSLGIKLITDLIKADKKVVFMYDNPDLDFSPISCLSYHPIKILEKVVNPCAVKKSVFQARSAEYDRVFVGITEKFPNITYFDPKKYMCDKEYCWAMKDGKLLYHDRHHLSEYGADLLIKKLVHY